MQTIFGPGKLVTHPTGTRQPTVTFVDPLVVGADEFAAMTLFFDADLRSAVAATIMASQELAIVATDDDQRIISQIEREIVTRPRSLASEAGKKPTRAKDPFHFQLEDFL